MKEKLDLYKNQDRLENALKRMQEDSDISPENLKTISEFVRFVRLKGNGLSRQIKYLYYSKMLAKVLKKDFISATKEDLKVLLLAIEDTKNAEGNHKFNGETKRDMRITLRHIYRMITNQENPEITAWIKLGPKSKPNITRSLVLEEIDVRKILEKCEDLRDKLLISLLYYSGARITEICSLKVKDCTLNDGLLLLTVTNFKTNEENRIVPVGEIETIELFKKFMQNHPERLSPEAFIFNSNRKMLRYSALRNRINRYGELAGINKPLNPHWFRHSRATLWAEGRFSEREIKYLGGWKSSDMVDRYVASDYKLVQSRFAEIYGKKNEDAQDTELWEDFKQIMDKLLSVPEQALEFKALLIKAGLVDSALKVAVKAREYGKLRLVSPQISRNKRMPLGRIPKKKQKGGDTDK